METEKAIIYFWNQSWFWAGFFAFASSIMAILIKELITTKSQIKLERIKAYESNIFSA